MRVKLEQTIGCSPEALWPWIDDPERSKQWMRGLVEVRPTSPGPRRKGSTAVVVIQEGRRSAEYDETILEYEPARRLKLRLVGGSFRGTGLEIDYKLDDLGGRTRLEYECGCELQNKVLAFFAPLFGVFARMQARSFFRKLRKLAESDSELAATT